MPNNNQNNTPQQEVGLFPVIPGREPGIAMNQEPSLKGDIIFVHGLGGHQWNTWHWQQQNDSSRKVDDSWPFWLAKNPELKELNVWTFGYDSSQLGQSPPLLEQAELLLNCLRAKQIGQKPLFFITHSLGGLVVKTMLRLDQDRKDSPNNNTQTVLNTKGIVFLGTPHNGSVLASFAQILPRLLVSSTAEVLIPSDERLRDLNRWYQIYAPRLKIGTLPFYEMRDTWGVRVVDQASANPNVTNQEEIIGVPRDHIEIAKVQPADHFVDPHVKNFILKYLNDDNSDKFSRGKLRELIEKLTEGELNPCLDRFPALLKELERKKFIEAPVETILKYFDKRQEEYPDFLAAVAKHSRSTYNRIYGNQ